MIINFAIRGEAAIRPKALCSVVDYEGRLPEGISIHDDFDALNYRIPTVVWDIMIVSLEVEWGGRLGNPKINNGQ